VKGLVHLITFLVFVGIILLAFLFAVNNPTEISLWLGLQLPVLSVGVLVISAFILGGVLGLILGLRILVQLKYTLQIRRLSTQLNKAKKTDDHRSHTGRQV
jgi:uncharacterized integral membrane protein